MKKTVKLSFLLAAILFVSVTFQACNPSVPNDIDVVLIMKSVDPAFEFWQVLKSGAEAAAKEFGVNLTVLGPQLEISIDEQISIVDQAIAKKPDVIVLAACDSAKLVGSAKSIVKNGIKLVTVDSDVDESLAECFVGTNNYTAAYELGSLMAKNADPTKQIAIVAHPQGTSTAQIREEAFLKGLSDNNGPEVIGVVYRGDDSSKAYDAVRNLLINNNNIGGLYATNQITGEGMAQAVQEMSCKGYFLSFDSSQKLNQYIELKVINGVAVQKPFNMGYISIKTAMECASGKRPDKIIDTGCQFVDLSNMYTDEIQKLIVPFVGK